MAETPEKYCKYCGAKLERRRYGNGRLEDNRWFRERNFCNRECRSKYLATLNTERISPGEYRRVARRIRYLFFQQNTKCELCGASERLEVHHKDHNYKNNSPDNLQVLCTKCHGKQHTITEKKCAVTGCDKEAKIHDYCMNHYRRLVLYGSPTAPHGNSLPVLQYSIDGVLIKRWESADEAEREQGFNSCCIGRCCRGKSKTHSGYIWKFEKEVER